MNRSKGDRESLEARRRPFPGKENARNRKLSKSLKISLRDKFYEIKIGFKFS